MQNRNTVNDNGHEQKMKTTIQYIDALYEIATETKNDSQLAKILGISRQTISQYRGGQTMSNRIAVIVAMLLDIDPMEIISSSMWEQSKTENDKQFWEAAFDMFKENGCREPMFPGREEEIKKLKKQHQ